MEELLQSGRRIRTRWLDVRRRDSSLGHVRVAIVVPKFGFTIVRRNKLKRRLRELARHHLTGRDSSCDVLLRARREAYDAEFAELERAVRDIAGQI